MVTLQYIYREYPLQQFSPCVPATAMTQIIYSFDAFPRAFH
jgi:hypothetical protein